MMLALPVAACTAVSPNFSKTPPLPANYGIDAASVVFSIQCEIVDALLEIGRRQKIDRNPNINEVFLRGWAASAVTELALEQDNSGGLSPNAKVAVASVNKLTGSVSLTGGIKRTRKGTVKTLILFNELLTDDPGRCHRPVEGENPIRRIPGALGLKEWMTHVLEGFSQYNVHLTQLTYKTEFIISNSFGGKLAFEPAANFVDSFGLKAEAGSVNQATHTLEFTTMNFEELSELRAAQKVPAKVLREVVRSLNAAEVVNRLREDDSQVLVLP